MAIDKDPSIYRDRGMIGSSDELDEYGVWVKSEPEDIASAPASSIEEPTLPDIEDLPDLELDSSEAFDFPVSESAAAPSEEEDVPLPSIAPSEKADFAVEESGEISGESLPSFEDIASFESDIPPVSSEDFTELSMDDFLETGSDEGKAGTGSLSEGDTLDIDLDFHETAEVQQEAAAEDDFDFQVEDETATAEGGAENPISLETVSDFDDFLNDLSDTEGGETAETGAPAPAPVAETRNEMSESADIAIEVEESESLETSFEAVEEAEDIVLSDFEVDTGVNAEQEPQPTAAETSSAETVEEEAFDDVAALSRDLSETEREAPTADAGLSTQLLMRIADELSSIKIELSSLKDELSVLRGEAKVERDEEKAPPASSHGFFDEEDDEKIALTGDELDNILNTADFTEEAGADATADISDEAVIDDFLMDRDDLIGGEESVPAADEGAVEESATQESAFEEPAFADMPLEQSFLEEGGFEEPAAQEPAVEEIETPEGPIEEVSFEEPAAQEPAAQEPAIERLELEEEPIEEVPVELQVLQETGVSPMTAAPEDTSYLEADDLASADIDLSGAVIDEPDLGDTIFEEPPVVEPSIDTIHLDLDMEESLHAESADETELEGDAGMENIELTLEEFVGEAEEENEAAEPAADAAAESVDEPFAEEMPESEPIPAFEEMEDAPEAEESFAEVVPEGFVVEPEEGSEPIGAEAETIETVDLAEEPSDSTQPLPADIRQEVKTVLSYMDQLLESLPEDKIEEFAKSEYFDTYKKLFEELGLV